MLKSPSVPELIDSPNGTKSVWESQPFQTQQLDHYQCPQPRLASLTFKAGSGIRTTSSATPVVESALVHRAQTGKRRPATTQRLTILFGLSSSYWVAVKVNSSVTMNTMEKVPRRTRVRFFTDLTNLT